MTRFPQYLSAPIQVLWFEADELGVIMFCFLLAEILRGGFWALMIIGPFLYSRAKLKYPKGFLKHMLYLSGIKPLHHYPSTFEKTFNE